MARAEARAEGGAAPAAPLYRWRLRSRLGERHGTLCRVLVRGRMNSILVEFLEDGWRVVTSRFAVRRPDAERG